MDRKLGVYLCQGCGIGECVSVEKLAQLASQEYQAPVIRQSPAFCLEDARMIREDVEKGAVDAVVVAACSGRVNTEIFSFPPATVERVSLREQVAWTHPPGQEETQSLANDYLRMGLVRARMTQPAKPYQEANQRTVLVVGSGIAGLTAAGDAARAGYEAVLVEKESQLGGFAARLHRQFPKQAPYRELQSVGLDSLLQELQSLPNVRIFTGAEVEKISGQPGAFSISIRQNGTVHVVTVGAIVMATGWRACDPALFEKYGLGKFENVITNITFEEMALQGKLQRPSDGRALKNVAILQCEGSEDEAHMAYSGNVTCLVSLKQALYLREANPDCAVYLIYQDMQTPGQYEYFYRRVQENPGVILSQGDVRSVQEDGEKNLVLEIANTPLGGGIELQADLVVLATGMAPASLDSQGLHLEYLQGSELPLARHGFPASNFICFPYETRRTGIYSAGCVRQPMDLAASARDGTAAALKAVQCIEKSSAGAAVHPRAGDLSYPSFFMPKCTSCGRCTQECPFGALGLDEKTHPVLDPNRCRRCGICMGACPVQIISFDDYSVPMLSSMIKAVEIPEGDEEKPRILAFACENDAHPAMDMAALQRLHYPASIRVIPVRCLGSVNTILITDALSRGFDGVALLGCKSGEDYQCHFIQGSELSGKRMENVREVLDQLALEPERIHFAEVAISESERIPAMLHNFRETIRIVGLNPFKGF